MNCVVQISFDINSNEDELEITNQVKAKIRNIAMKYKSINTGSSGLGTSHFSMSFLISKYKLKPFLTELGRRIHVNVISVERKQTGTLFCILDNCCHNFCVEGRRKYARPSFEYLKNSKKYSVTLKTIVLKK